VIEEFEIGQNLTTNLYEIGGEMSLYRKAVEIWVNLGDVVEFRRSPAILVTRHETSLQPTIFSFVVYCIFHLSNCIYKKCGG
jgi:hypothetical protein